MSYFLGTGWWILWYGTLWLAVAPFAVMTAMLCIDLRAGFYAVVRENPMPNRWAAQVLCLPSALGLHFLCLHATWRFRHR
jgi:hypothetical protein